MRIFYSDKNQNNRELPMAAEPLPNVLQWQQLVDVAWCVRAPDNAAKVFSNSKYPHICSHLSIEKICTRWLRSVSCTEVVKQRAPSHTLVRTNLVCCSTRHCDFCASEKNIQYDIEITKEKSLLHLWKRIPFNRVSKRIRFELQKNKKREEEKKQPRIEMKSWN